MPTATARLHQRRHAPQHRGRSTRAAWPIATLAGILILAAGCDKAGNDPGLAAQAGSTSTDISGRPDVLFLVFGDTGDTRIVPVAVLADRGPQPITLDASGWHRFDSLYFAPGTEFPAYASTAAAGSAVVTRAMWKGQEAPLYSIPGCASTVPLAGVRVAPQRRDGFSVELLAASRELPQATRAVVAPPAAATGPAILRRAAARAGIDTTTLDQQNFIVRAFDAGATGQPTVVASYLEGVSRRGGSAAASTSHILVISDSLETGRAETYVHVGTGGPGGEFRRLIDRIDLDGDGVDELVLEGWRLNGQAFPLILKWSGNRWQETFRGRDSWCLDARRR